MMFPCTETMAHQSVGLLNNQDGLVVVLPKSYGSIGSGCTTADDEHVNLVCLRIRAGPGQSGT